MPPHPGVTWRAWLPPRQPPLRERLSDLGSPVESLGEDIARRSGLPPRSFSPDTVALLARRHWPGNIRELRSGPEQAALMTDDLVPGVQRVYCRRPQSAWRSVPYRRCRSRRYSS